MAEELSLKDRDVIEFATYRLTNCSAETMTELTFAYLSGHRVNRTSRETQFLPSQYDGSFIRDSVYNLIGIRLARIITNPFTSIPDESISFIHYPKHNCGL